MKMPEALRIMAVGITPKGYRVCFERVEGSVLASDFFPDRCEPLIASQEEAWIMAYAFAQKTKGRCVNLYVTNDDFTPVEGYRERKIENR